MAVDWQCPKCDRKIYSAWDSRDKKNVECIYCGYEFKNKYYTNKTTIDIHICL